MRKYSLCECLSCLVLYPLDGEDPLGTAVQRFSALGATFFVIGACAVTAHALRG